MTAAPTRPPLDPAPEPPARSAVAGRLVAWLAAHPWLTTAELAALAEVNPRTARHQLARLAAAGRVRPLVVEVAPWPRAALHALAGPDGPPPAPLRLARLEHLRALHALLARLAPAGEAPTLTARLRGEPGGPPVAGAPHRLAGLADAWLVDPDGRSGLLVRWDDGDRHEWAERAWLAALADLLPVAPPAAIVCATPAARRRWTERLRDADRLPPLRLVTALDLADAGRAPGRRIWRDEHGGVAPPPALAPLPPALLAAPPPPAPDRRAAALAARRLALGATGLAALRAIARRPLLTTADLARLLACSPSLAYARVAALVAARLARRLAPGEGTPGGDGGRVAEAARPLWVTRSGFRLLAAAAGESPAGLRARTPLAGGAVARPGRPGGSRALGRLARHRQHTRDLVRLHEHARRAVADARRAGRPVELLDWQGPVTRPVRFPTDDPTLARRPPAWAAPPGAGRYGQVEPDAIARLALGERRLTLLIEWDRGTEGRARLARKLRHYIGWGASPAAADALALVITTTPARAALVRALAAELAQRRGLPPPPLLATTADLVVAAGLLAAIGRAPDAPPAPCVADRPPNASTQ